MERQRTIVEQLAQAYKSVAEEIRGLSQPEPSRRQGGIQRRIVDIQNQQEAQRRERVLAASPEVLEARATVAARQKELENADTLPRRIRADAELGRAKQRLKAAEDTAAAIGVRAPTRDERNAVGALLVPAAGVFFSPQQRVDQLRQRQAELDAAGNDPVKQLEVLNKFKNLAIQQSADPIKRSAFPGAERALVEIEKLIIRLEGSIKTGPVDGIAARIAKNALRIATTMESANSDLQAAFEGTSGASAIEAEIAAFSESLSQFVIAAEEARSNGDVERAKALQGDIEYINRHIDALRAAATAVLGFSAGLKRFSDSVARDVAALEQRAEDARRADVQPSRTAPDPFDPDRSQDAGTARTRDQRRRAEEQAEDARRRQRKFEDDRASLLEKIEQERIARNDPRLEERRKIDAQLAVAMGETGADGTRGGTAEERKRARERRREIDEELDAEYRRDPRAAEMRRRADAEAEKAARIESGDRGRQLTLTDGQRARLELDKQLADIESARISRLQFDERDNEGRRRDQINLEAENARKRVTEEAFRNTAPAIFALADSVQNALLQGPSRAALQASDVSTVEGSRELSRLLRGDDAARNQDLVQLQKEANRLLDLIANNPANVAN